MSDFSSSEIPNSSDTISRQAAIDAVIRVRELHAYDEIEELKALPSVESEPSIPLSWIEKHIEWLKSLDNEFANLAATHISVMVKKWRGEQE